MSDDGSRSDDTVEHKLDEARGKAKEQVGKLTDDESLERQGRREQAESDLKQAGDKVKDAFGR